jgi:hypothetical protein
MRRQAQAGKICQVTVPVLRAEMESGTVWDDPSEDMLFELPSDIERGEEQFIVVERTVDPSHPTYAQAIGADGGGWLLERRDGSADRHFRALLADLRAAHHALTAWAFELPDWRDAAEWEKTTL